MNLIFFNYLSYKYFDSSVMLIDLTIISWGLWCKINNWSVQQKHKKSDGFLGQYGRLTCKTTIYDEWRKRKER